MGVTIGIDVGGTKIAGGVVDESGAIVARTRRDTPSTDPEAIIHNIVTVIDELRAGREVDGVGVGSAGFVDAARSTVMFAPNLAWRDVPVREQVSSATGLHVVVENDANAAAWGEFRFGAAEDVNDMVCVTTCPDRSERAPVRMWQSRLRRAVRERPGADPGSERAGPRRLGLRDANARDGGRRPGGDHRPDGHPSCSGGRSACR
jgi:ROK family